MSLSIDINGWGEASTADLEKVLQSVCDQFQEIGISVTENILIRQSFEDGPMVLREKGPDGEHEVLLSSDGCSWCQHAYQFAHEYCHIFVDHHKASYRHNYKWFEESICELASIWCLRKMSIHWSKNPPYANWQDYSKTLGSYAENIVEPVTVFDTDAEFRIWLDGNMQSMQANPLIRLNNRVVAIRLLSCFDEYPNLWNVVREINIEPELDKDFTEYLRNWERNSSEPKLVRLLSDRMGYSTSQD